MLIIARSYAALNDYANAVSALENWVNAHGSGSEAGTLLEGYVLVSETDAQLLYQLTAPEYAALLGLSRYRFASDALARACRMVEAQHGLTWRDGHHQTGMNVEK